MAGWLDNAIFSYDSFRREKEYAEQGGTSDNEIKHTLLAENMLGSSPSTSSEGENKENSSSSDTTELEREEEARTDQQPTVYGGTGFWPDFN
jgi:hypothetical protein